MPLLQPPSRGGISDEIFWRGRAYQYILSNNTNGNIPPTLLRDEKVYGGAAGVWCDRTRTIKINNKGICVSILNIGDNYNDYFLDDALIYRYPDTNRSENADINEIEAVRECLYARVPIFVILPGNAEHTRTLKLGWIIGDMPGEKAFLVSLREADPGRIGHNN
jgi:hypothetical protein